MFTTSRTNTYERLEGGMGPGRSSKKLAWKKIAIGCGILMGLVWFFGPRRDTLPGDLPIQEELYPPSDKLPFHVSATLSPEYGVHPTSAPSSPSSTPSVIPTSPETDPDPLKTVHCTHPYSPDLPLVQYALMIDAGSQGSRIHIYKFHHCSASPTYEYEVFKMTQPGLSAYASSPSTAAQSLDVLLDEAMRVVPETLRGCTPVAVKATAGLRALGVETSRGILERVEERLRERWPFVVPEKEGVVIMDGREEGVYAWITANYLLGMIRSEAAAASPTAASQGRTQGRGGTTTYAVLDLGGGSTQIVFEPEGGDEKGDEVVKEGEHKYELVFGGKERVLYQHSYLGYGLKSARESVHRVIEFMDSLRRPATATNGSGDLVVPRIPNPCLAQKTTKEVEIPVGNGEENKMKVLMAGEDVGSFEACNRVLELVMAKDAVCEVKPCSFNGVYQPSLLDAFPTGKVLLLSYFYDRAMPLLPPAPTDGQPQITVATFGTLAQQVCAGPSSWIEHWGSSPDVIEELEDRPEWCLDLTFMHALLGLGYEFEDTREVALGKRIEGTELGWCLGATIAMVGGGEVKCRV